MDTPTAGARVWVNTDGTVRHGVISSVCAMSAVLENQPLVTIVLDDSGGVVATSVVTRGKFWDFERNPEKDEPRLG